MRECDKCGLEFHSYDDCEDKGTPEHICLNNEEIGLKNEQ